ncbi:MAG: GNAT family N-acetyltransferase [Alphaproteobacteria bacterium]|nr:GNAT family N-acetyltransferase [Alphaproteobacteria bacterium]
MISSTPEIATQRLVLRAHRASDLDACAAIWGDPEVTRFIGGKPSTREEAWSRILRCAGLWRLLGYGFWAVEERESGRLLGDVGVMEAKRDIDPPFEGEPEAGWAFTPAVHGRGYALEAVTAMMGWADANLTAPKLVCIIHPDNAPSIRLAGKAGFRERIRTTYHGEPTIQFDRPRKR